MDMFISILKGVGFGLTALTLVVIVIPVAGNLAIKWFDFVDRKMK